MKPSPRAIRATGHSRGRAVQSARAAFVCRGTLTAFGHALAWGRRPGVRQGAIALAQGDDVGDDGRGCRGADDVAARGHRLRRDWVVLDRGVRLAERFGLGGAARAAG